MVYCIYYNDTKERHIKFMVDYLILTEKPSAAKNFVAALGGRSGNFDGKSFQIVNARGHLMTFVEPQKMVDPSLEEQYASWSLKDMPWKPSEMNWHKTYQRGKNPRTGKVESTKSLVEDIKKAASNAKAIVIATDTDPSGEGDLLAWEIIKAIGWSGKVYRANFVDEGKASIEKAMRNLTDVSDSTKHGAYLKSEARNKWDFLSMQLTRIATTVARVKGYNVRVANQGRLKSVILFKTYDQLRAIENYVKTPYYEVKFQNENGHKFTRKFEDGVDEWRFKTEDEANKDMASYHDSEVANVKRTRKTKAPDKLLDLSALSSILSKKGFPAKTVLATYQKMYEAQIVSYPRTEDKTITPGQFNDLDPLIDKIADVVGVDKSLLTHRSPRKTHVKAQGAHGANRPGMVVPKSLASLDATYGKGAKEIYDILAKNYLAMYGEDYVYEAVSANLKDYPDFKTSFSIPIEMNYKAVFDSASANSDDDDDADENGNGDIGTVGSPFVYEGANKKPSKPTMTWIMKFLEKHDVGTGATRVSTLGELTAGKNPLMKESRGKLTLTDAGKVSAILSEGTYIASVDATKKLFDMMDRVGKLEQEPAVLLKSAQELIKHDMKIMHGNVDNLDGVVAKSAPRKEKVTATINGQEIAFSSEWGGHKFTDAELDDLKAGKSITFESKFGKVSGKLTEQTYKGKQFWGFKKEEADKATAKVGGKAVKFKQEWSGHKFTPQEIADLSEGKEITFKFKTKAGKEMEATGKLEEQSFKGKKFWGFKVAKFDGKPIKK